MIPMKTLKICALLVFLSTFAFGGARGGKFYVVNISEQPMNKEGKRLFELIQKDLKELYTDDKHEFAWDTEGTTVTTVKPETFKGVFKPMIITKDKKKLDQVLENLRASDGVIAFQYDLAGKYVRLKHIDYDGNESMLIRLPLNIGGAMNLSLWKERRRAALVAIGKSFEFNP